MKYDPFTGIFGMDFYVVLKRPGSRVGLRRRCKTRIGAKHKISKDEAMEWFKRKYDGAIYNWEWSPSYLNYHECESINMQILLKINQIDQTSLNQIARDLAPINRLLTFLDTTWLNYYFWESFRFFYYCSNPYRNQSLFFPTFCLSLFRINYVLSFISALFQWNVFCCSRPSCLFIGNFSRSTCLFSSKNLDKFIFY